MRPLGSCLRGRRYAHTTAAFDDRSKVAAQRRLSGIRTAVLHVPRSTDRKRA